MRKILFLIFSFLLINLCYSEEMMKSIDKIIYSHIGIQNKPVWATQISYRDLGGYKIPNTDMTNEVFYYGLRWRDSVMGPVHTYTINKNCYDQIKQSVETYPEKKLSIDSLLNYYQFGTMCISIVENGKISRWYFSKDNIIKLFETQVLILESDSTAREFNNQINSLKKSFINCNW